MTPDVYADGRRFRRKALLPSEVVDHPEDDRQDHGDQDTSADWEIDLPVPIAKLQVARQPEQAEAGMWTIRLSSSASYRLVQTQWSHVWRVPVPLGMISVARKMTTPRWPLCGGLD